MVLYFLRHGLAEDRETWKGSDASRPLTERGVKRLAAQAANLPRLDMQLDVILSSPYLRALQTAQIVARQLDLMSCLEQDERLVGLDISELQAILKDHPDANNILLVGHEPDFSLTVGALIGGARLVFKKAGLARVDLFSGPDLQGELTFLLTPKLLESEL